MFSCYGISVPLPGSDEPLLDEVSLEIDDGEWAEVVGPAGSGKSILYSLMTLEDRPPEGRLVIGGRNLDRLGRQGCAELRRRFGTCRQEPELLEERTAAENLALPLVVRGDSDRAGELIDDALAAGELEDQRDVEARNLSAGERKLLGILRATVGEPEAVVVDGGLSSLDRAQRRRAGEVLSVLHGRGTTVVLFGREPSGAGPEENPSYVLEGGRIERME